MAIKGIILYKNLVTIIGKILSFLIYIYENTNAMEKYPIISKMKKQEEKSIYTMFIKTKIKVLDNIYNILLLVILFIDFWNNIVSAIGEKINDLKIKYGIDSFTKFWIELSSSISPVKKLAIKLIIIFIQKINTKYLILIIISFFIL